MNRAIRGPGRRLAAPLELHTAGSRQHPRAYRGDRADEGRRRYQTNDVTSRRNACHRPGSARHHAARHGIPTCPPPQTRATIIRSGAARSLRTGAKMVTVGCVIGRVS